MNRRKEALDRKRTWDESYKTTVRKNLIGDAMSSEDQEDYDGGPRTFLVKRYRWRTKKFEDILNQLDAKYQSIKSKRAVFQNVSRAVGGVSDKVPPKFLVKIVFRLWNNDTL